MEVGTHTQSHRSTALLCFGDVGSAEYGTSLCRQETASDANVDVCNVATLLMPQFTMTLCADWTSSANVATAGSPPVPHGLHAAVGPS